jgi:hypothetical protein
MKTLRIVGLLNMGMSADSIFAREVSARGIRHRADARHDRGAQGRRGRWQLRHLFGRMWPHSFHCLKS